MIKKDASFIDYRMFYISLACAEFRFRALFAK